MNVLPLEKQSEIIAALTEGCSIRATERLTGVHRDTVMRLGFNVGVGCGKLHDKLMRDLNVARLEFDEIFSFVGKKARNVKASEPDSVGTQYTFIALAGAAKAIIAYHVGKRSMEHTEAFVRNVRFRVNGAPEISTDGWPPYPAAIEKAFKGNCSHGVVEKRYAAVEAGPDAARRYSPGKVVSVEVLELFGQPKNVSTSYVERQNLTLRMQQRRFTRLTNAFSKKFEHHCAAVALYAMHYNFCRVHEALRITPAMQLGVTDHIWTISELVQAALNPTSVEKPIGRKRGPFTVLDGGKK